MGPRRLNERTLTFASCLSVIIPDVCPSQTWGDLRPRSHMISARGTTRIQLQIVFTRSPAGGIAASTAHGNARHNNRVLVEPVLPHASAK